LFLAAFADLGNTEIEELDIVFDFFTYILYLVMLRFEVRVILVLCSSQPEVVTFLPVSAIVLFPPFIIVESLSQDGRGFKIIFTIFPFIDELVALFNNFFELFFHLWIIVIFK